MIARVVRFRGFTLIEMLVALALMALIATILITSLQLGGHTWQRVMRSSAETEDIAQAQEILRARLGTLYPEDRPASGINAREIVVSSGSSLQFSGAAPEATAAGILRYQIDVSASSGALEIRSWFDRLSRLPGSVDSSTETLLPNVASLSIRFWSKPDATPGRWLDRWESKNVPQLIWVDVGFAPGDKRRWPPLYIEPRIDTPASCVFDVVSRRCRSGA